MELSTLEKTTSLPIVQDLQHAGRKVQYVKQIDGLQNIPDDVKEVLKKVADKYVFRANDYYLGLIDWDDANDPIRQLIIPRVEELDDWGKLDASNEAAVTVAKGAQHKYQRTTLLLCNEVCGAYCRYCFRKRLFMDDNDEATLDVNLGLDYIRKHKEVTNVLLTGGDPLLMSTRKLGKILSSLREIDHVDIIRIGTKMPAFNPWRILDDPKLLELLREHSTQHKRIYIMAHFDHPRELTPAAVEGLDALMKAGCIIVNQCPLIKGVNDDVSVLAELYQKLEAIGVPPYYLFQGRITEGNGPYEVPLVRGWQIFDQARRRASGLGRRARFCMSHDTGKVEIVGVDDKHIYMRYHQTKDPMDESRFMVFHRDDSAYWFDQLKPVEGLGGPALDIADGINVPGETV
ncbi:MAG: KamA family radical SAM protein [Deltaproteobacteria bacterium]|nr:KamA family radical SAM protein [Deltaproteobacteria bacterium]